ncbi:MAG: Yip1 family protein [Clostridiaceae bacterium]
MEEMEEEKITFMEKVKCFFVKPSKVFEGFIEKPKYWKLYLIVSVLTYIGTLLSRSSTKAIMDKANTTGDPQVQSIMNLITGIATNPIFLMFSSFLMVLIGMYVISFIYWLISLIVKTEASYTQIVCVYLTSSIAVVIGSLFKGVYSIITKNPIVSTTSISYMNIFTKFDVFYIWYVVLFIIGLAKVGNVSKKKAAIIILIVVALSLAFQLISIKISMNAPNMQY